MPALFSLLLTFKNEYWLLHRTKGTFVPDPRAFFLYVASTETIGCSGEVWEGVSAALLLGTFKSKTE